jgi:hypothetical protein
MARLYLSLVLLGLIFPCKAQQQSLLSTAGDYFQTTGYSLSWSMGETVTETWVTGNHILTQGFQQSMLEPVGVTEPKNPNEFGIAVFPNPTQGLVYVQVSAEQLSQPGFPNWYLLYDIQGKLLQQDPLTQQELIIDLNLYSGAVYYLRLYNAESNSQSTFIIQKID